MTKFKYGERICKILGTDYPLVQGGMAWVAEANLAAAVSEGGGLGLIAAGSAPADWVREQIRAVRAKTNKPFGVNIMLMSPFAEEIAKVITEERVPVVTTGAGSPGIYMQAWKEIGTVVIPVVASVALAVRMQRSGADALIAEGCEAGGHIGELTTMTLVPMVSSAVEIPVIAAGGIADGRGLAAAFMLGAEGVQIGTRFVVADECRAHDNFKAKILKAGDLDTVVTGRSTGHPVRSLKNKMTRSLTEKEREGITPEEFEQIAAGSLQRAVIEGDMDQGSMMAGQSAGLVKQQQKAADIIKDLFEDAGHVLARFKD